MTVVEERIQLLVPADLPAPPPGNTHQAAAEAILADMQIMLGTAAVKELGMEALTFTFETRCESFFRGLVAFHYNDGFGHIRSAVEEPPPKFDVRYILVGPLSRVYTNGPVIELKTTHHLPFNDEASFYRALVLLLGRPKSNPGTAS